MYLYIIYIPINYMIDIRQREFIYFFSSLEVYILTNINGSTKNYDVKYLLQFKNIFHEDLKLTRKLL